MTMTTKEKRLANRFRRSFIPYSLTYYR